MNKQYLIMQDIYSNMVDYISSVIFNNEQWVKDKQFFDFENIMPFDTIIKFFGGIGYTDAEIKYCYDTIKNHYIECKELNIQATK